MQLLDMLKGFVLVVADAIAIVGFQLAEDKRG
jgi:hypothetical protein